MKRLLLFFTTLTFISSFGQIIEVANGLSYTRHITVFEDKLFIAETDKISTININEDDAEVSDFLTDVNDLIYGFAIDGNNLFISYRLAGKISKIDLSDSASTLTDVITGLDNPKGIAIKDNFLYIAERRGISKVNFESSTPEIIDIISDISSPYGLAFNGDDLYMTEFTGSKVSKIDITRSTPTAITIIDNLVNPYDLTFNNDDLYVTEGNNSGKVLKIDTSTNTYISEEVLSDLDFPTGILVNGEELFVVETENNISSISKINISLLSTDEDFNKNEELTIYPNPSNHKIKILGIQDHENYKIFNIQGNEVITGNALESGQIDVSELSGGVYFLRLSNKITKFIKN